MAVALAALLAGCDDSGGTAGATATRQATNSLVARTTGTISRMPGTISGATGNDGSKSGAPKSTHATSGEATLSWEAPTSNTNGSALTDLSGYRIYYGATEELTETVQITNIGLQTYVFENLAPGTWYFAIRALSSEGTESPLSDTVSKTIG